MKTNDVSKDVWKSFRKANRELQFERNGGGQFVATDRAWKNKKKYDRKRDRRINFDCPSLFYRNFRLCIFNNYINSVINTIFCNNR